MLPEIGIAGQEKLKNAKVIVVGAGGLGCPILQYLAAAGVGKIAIAEFDMVNETNLQRQVLYGTGDVGKLKSIIATGRIELLNNLIETVRINLRIDSSNSLRIFSDFDIIVDATDNYPARYIINDTCVILNKPMVHGAIFKHEGQVSVFNYHEGPTYRCYNPQIKSQDFKNPLPDDVGLLGVLPGMTGTIMANEVIKIITETGDVLAGKVLIFNIYEYSFNIMEISNIPENHIITKMNDNY
jgi:sulfur-carrier protein adenylyltransferase/sulfurtransferase